MEKNPIHTVIFDLDGTLSDTVILTMGALNRIAPEFGLEVPKEKDVRESTGYAAWEFYCRMFPGTPHDILKIAGPLISQGELDELVSIKEKVLFDGCTEMLKRLNQLGIRMYIASTGSKDHVYTILSESGILDYFDLISCERADKTEMIRDMINGRDKSGFAMVGDMIKDQEAARNNGILSIGACFGYCDRETSDFDLYIDHPMDLFDILDF
jgi:phosphoglycolate phosphatase-like HAD superfamily hydrolase